jgi:hypothetical protein
MISVKQPEFDKQCLNALIADDEGGMIFAYEFSKSSGIVEKVK